MPMAGRTGKPCRRPTARRRPSSAARGPPSRQQTAVLARAAEKGQEQERPGQGRAQAPAEGELWRTIVGRRAPDATGLRVGRRPPGRPAGRPRRRRPRPLRRQGRGRTAARLAGAGAQFQRQGGVAEQEAQVEVVAVEQGEGGAVQLGQLVGLQAGFGQACAAGLRQPRRPAGAGQVGRGLLQGGPAGGQVAPSSSSSPPLLAAVGHLSGPLSCLGLVAAAVAGRPTRRR